MNCNTTHYRANSSSVPGDPTGFAIIWYIWWLAILGLIGAFAIFVWYAWRDEHEHIIPVEVVRENARERRRIRMEHLHSISQST